jgi:hypothetical protein
MLHRQEAWLRRPRRKFQVQITGINAARELWSEEGMECVRRECQRAIQRASKQFLYEAYTR